MANAAKLYVPLEIAGPTGATQATRYAGATSSGSPASGTFAKGDFVVAQNGHIFVCTTAGSPGTWADVGTSAGVSSLARSGGSGITGAVILASGGGLTLTDSGQTITLTVTSTTGELDYVERTSNLTVTATSDATAQSFIDGNAVSYDGTTRIKIEFYAPVFEVANNQNIVANLYDGSTDIGRMVNILGASGVTADATVYAARFLTPSNASHTYHVKVWKTGGTATAYAGAGGAATYMPAWYRITAA